MSNDQNNAPDLPPQAEANEAPNETPTETPNEQQPSPTPLEPNPLDQLSQLSQLDQLKHLDRIAQSLEILASRDELTTEIPPQSGETLEPVRNNPMSEIPVQGDDKEIILPDGRTVPTNVVRALTEYNETTWPGALMPEARAAIAHVVIKAVAGDQKPVLRTNYPFCLNDDAPLIDSPCIKRSGHPGRHQDNNDGVW